MARRGFLPPGLFLLFLLGNYKTNPAAQSRKTGMSHARPPSREIHRALNVAKKAWAPIELKGPNIRLLGGAVTS